MKKVIKNPLLTFILGVLISGGIVYATTQISASSITYNNTTLDQVLDNIYETIGDKIIIGSFGAANYSESMGDAVAYRSTTLNLTKGKYLIISLTSLAYTSSSKVSTSTDIVNNSSTLTVSSGTAEITQLTKKSYSNSASEAKNSNYSVYQLGGNLYHVTVSSNEAIINAATVNTKNSTYQAQVVALQAIPLN